MTDLHPHRVARPRRRAPLQWVLLALGLLILAGAVGIFELREDPPSIPQPKTGDLIGTLAPAADIATLSAVSRVTSRRYEPTEWSPATGRFRFRALPGDASYDLCLQMTDGRRIEGIDLSWFEARFHRLAAIRRKQLGITDPAPHTFTKADADAMVGIIAQRKDFSDINRPLYIRGDGGKAVMLVERIRSERFHAAEPAETIWRTDLMYFTYDVGGWQILPNTRRLVERRRFGPNEWGRFTIAYDHRLTAYLDEEGRVRPLTFAVPAEFPHPTGRLAGQAFYPPPSPVVLNPAADGAAPATAPVDR